MLSRQAGLLRPEKDLTWYGGNSKATGEIVAFPHSVIIKPSETERPALEQDGRFFYPMYLGPYGWLGLDLTAAKVDWDEIAELIDMSFRLVATATLISRLDHRTEGTT